MTPAPHPPGSKQHEKNYLKRTGVAEWDRLKPFAPPGRDTLEESLALIHDFAVAVGCLAPTPADRILDLGAGACWCSEWLERLNLRVVSLDISPDMLALGRTRLRDRQRLVAGDMEHLPFADRSFDKAICLNALHHVPDIPKALREIARVLDEAGVAVFAEPGRGHHEKPTSLAAVRDFGVLEQEILVADFLQACERAGFADTRIVPFAYALPWIGLEPAEWAAWQQQARRRRPWRAAEKIWRGAIELVGWGSAAQSSRRRRSGVGHVRLGVQLLDADGRLLDRDFSRANLPADVPPGSAVTLDVTFDAPPAAGTYSLKLDLVAEGVSWFESHRSRTVTVALVVRGRGA